MWFALPGVSKPWITFTRIKIWSRILTIRNNINKDWVVLTYKDSSESWVSHQNWVWSSHSADTCRLTAIYSILHRVLCHFISDIFYFVSKLSFDATWAKLGVHNNGSPFYHELHSIISIYLCVLDLLMSVTVEYWQYRGVRTIIQGFLNVGQSFKMTNSCSVY